MKPVTEYSNFRRERMFRHRLLYLNFYRFCIAILLFFSATQLSVVTAQKDPVALKVGPLISAANNQQNVSVTPLPYKYAHADYTSVAGLGLPFSEIFDAKKHFVTFENDVIDSSCFQNDTTLREMEVLVMFANCSDSENNGYLNSKLFHFIFDDVSVVEAIDASEYGDVYPVKNVLALRGRHLGRTRAHLYFSKNSGNVSTFITTMNIVVVRVERFVDTLFIVVVMLLMMAAYVGMGCAVELSVVKEVLKKPLPPFIGFCSQYFIMPLTAFGLVRIFNLSGGIGLGFFASGCSPGGGASNMYTYMLGGDTSLSVTMTVVSTLTALVMFPAWLYALRYFIPGVEGTTFKIPYYNILASLATMVIPLTIGILIRLKRPQLACSIKKALKPFFAFIIIFLFTVGIWSNIYLVYLFSAKLFLAACILSYSGFLLGGFFAFICRLPLARIIAVAIETGVQNTGLPILLLKFSLMQPEADMSVVSPVSVAMFMPVPLWIAIAVLEVRKCVNKKKQTDPKEPLDLLVGDQRLTSDGGEELNDELDELATNRDSTNNRSTKLEYSENGNVPKIVIDSDNDLKPCEKHEGDI